MIDPDDVWEQLCRALAITGAVCMLAGHFWLGVLLFCAALYVVVLALWAYILAIVFVFGRGRW